MKTKNILCTTLIIWVLHFNLYSQSRNNLLPISKNHLWGIMDTLGNEVLTPKYDNIQLTDYPNRAIFYQNNKQGLLGEKGQILFEARYRSVFVIDSVHALLEKDSTIGIYHITKGLVKEGKIKSYTAITSTIHAFREDSTYILVNLKNSKLIWIPAESIGNSFIFNDLNYFYFKNKGNVGVFDENSTLTFPPSYNEIIPQANLQKWIVKQNGKYGIVNLKGKVLQAPQFDRIEPNFGYLRVYKDKKIGILDTTARLVIPVKYEVIRKDLSYWFVEGNRKVGLLDAKYQELLPSIYESIAKSEDYWIVKKDGKYGVLNARFQLFVNFEYDNIWIDKNYFSIVKGGNQGIKLKNGITVLDPLYPKATLVNTTTFIVEKDGKSAIYTDKVLVSKWYNSISPFQNETYFLCTTKENTFGVIDRTGKSIIPCQYQKIEMPYQKVFVVTSDKKQKLISTKGENLSDWYQDIFPLSEKFLKVKTNNRFGVVDYTNKQIVHSAYKSISYEPICDLFLVGGFNYRISLSELDLNRYYISDFSLLPKYELQNVDTSELFIPSKKKKALDSLPEKKIKSLNLDTVYYFGYVNKKNQLLLDTLFRHPQLEFDPILKQIKVETDTAMIVVSLEDDGSLIDKIHFKNWVKIQERTDKKKYHWKYDLSNFYQGNARLLKWGLLDQDDNIAVAHKFDAILQAYPKDSTFTRTSINSSYYIIKGDEIEKTLSSQRRNVVFGIVNTLTGKEVLPTQYTDFVLSDFATAPLARAIWVSGSMELIDKNFNRQKKVYRFIDNFQNGYARVNFGGTYVCYPSLFYSIEESNTVPTCLTSPSGVNVRCMGGKWGIIDTTGKIIQPLAYDFIQREFNSRFIAQRNGQWGILTHSFDTLIPFKYTEIRNFMDETKKNAWANIPFYKVRINKKWGVINEANKMVVARKYDFIKYLGNEHGHFFAVVNYVNKIAYWGLVNEKGDTLIPLKYDDISYVDNQTKQYFLCKTRHQPMGYIDTVGTVLYDATFEKTQPFSQNRAAVSENGEYWNFIDKKGTFITNYLFEQVHNFSEDLAAVCIDKWGFVDTTGKFQIDLKYIKVGDFHQGLAWATLARKPLFFGLWKRSPRTCYIDKSGKFVIKAKYYVCSDFDNGSAIVQTKNKSQVIDTKGSIVYRGSKKIVSLSNPYGWMLAKKENGEIQLINRKGEGLVKGKTFEIDNISNGLVIIKLDGKYGVIDSSGQEVFKCEYDKIMPFSEDMARVKKGALWGFVNADTHILKPEYRSCTDFLNGVAQVKTPKRTFYIDKEGNELSKDSVDKLQKIAALPVPQKAVKKNAIVPKRLNLTDNLLLNKGKDSKYGLIKIKNSMQVMPPIFDDVSPFSEGVSSFSLKDKFWIYDSKGNQFNKRSFQSINKLYNQSIFQLQSFDQFFYLKTDGTLIERK